MNSIQSAQDQAEIRWMISRDIPDVVRIEQECYENPWTEEVFLQTLRQFNCIGMVMVVDERVVGYVVYELHPSKLHVVNLAVHPAYRRHGLGSRMVAKLISKLSSHRRTRICLEVRETNLVAQLFFRSQGFKALRIEHGFFDDNDEDAYVMEYRLPTALAASPAGPVNRIMQYEGS